MKSLLKLKLIMLVILGVLGCTSNEKNRFQEYIEAHNSHNVSKTMNFYSKDVHYENLNGWLKIGAKDVRELEEFDAVTESHYDVADVKAFSDTVQCTIVETNKFHKLAGIDQIRFIAQYVFAGDSIIDVKEKLKYESIVEIRDKMKTFYSWMAKNRTDEWNELMFRGNFMLGTEGGKRWLAMLEEWRDAKSGEQAPADSIQIM